MTEEWGPWIEHHGLSVPVRDGVVVKIQMADGDEVVGIVKRCTTPATECNVWIWAECREKRRWSWRVIRYCVRKPKGLQILEEQLREIPDPVPAEMPDEVPA